MPKAIRLGLAIAALIGAAAGDEIRAADAPVAPAYKAPILAPAASYNWTGFYVGVNAGGSWGRSGTDVILDQPRTLRPPIEIPIGSASQALNGVLGGLQAGYNLQTNALVFGVEADIQLTGQKGDTRLPGTITTIAEVGCFANPCPPPAPPIVTTGTLGYAQRLPWFSTLRGRVGVTPADRWLVYATGGLTVGEIRTDASFTGPAAAACLAPGPCAPAPGSVAASFSQTKAGWVVGGGVEAALGGGWTGKLEYLHMDLGGIANSFASTVDPFIGTFRASSRVTDDIVRVGVNYRFGGAVVTKY
jgi:outer membrane immunogenic protein